MRRRKATRAAQYERRAFRDAQRRLAAAVRALRKSRGWTQEEAAHASDMSTRLLQRIETATVNVTLTTLARLCDGFDVDICGLFTAHRARAHSASRTK